MSRRALVALVVSAVALAPAAADAVPGPRLHADPGLVVRAVAYGKHGAKVHRLAHPARISCHRMSRPPARVAPPRVSLLVARSAFHYTCSHQTTWWYYNGWWHRLYSQGYDAYGHWHTYQIVAPGSSVSHWRTFYCTAA